MGIESGPYVGPRPFEREDQACFFGRGHETRELCSLVIGHPLVLLYASSGTGKTSLLNAGLIPRLEEEGFDVLPLARVRGSIPSEIKPEEISNLYVFNTLMGWVQEDLSSQGVIGLTITDFLKERAPSGDAEDEGATILIFDQFEELFSFYPERKNDRENFFDQLRNALESIPCLRVIIVIREDYLADIDSYSHLLPDQLRTRFRLEGMGEAAALAAVTGPLQTTGCTFAPGVAETLVKELLRVKLETAAGKIEVITGEVVEPVQLQVVCQSLWRELPPNVTEITLDHLHAFGDVNQALADFYEKAVAAAVHATQVPEGALRLWFENRLITPAETRGTVFKGKEETDGIPNQAVDVLEGLHLIRGEWRSGARWYEITHDRFIEPIKDSNRQWLKEHWEVEQERQRLEKMAVEWIRLGREQGGLLDEVELLEAERSLKTFDAAELCLSEEVSALIQASKAAIDEAQRVKEAARQRELAQAQALAEAEAARAKVATRSAQKARRFSWALGGCSVLIIVALVASIVAFQATQLSQEHKRKLFSVDYASAARQTLNQDPELSVLLALQAVAQTYPQYKMVTPAAEMFLHRAIQSSRVRLTLSAHTDRVASAVFSPDGTRIATGSWDGTAKIWDAISGQELVSISKPEMIRVWIGVGFGEIPEVLVKELNLPEGSGVYVNQVIDGDPAANAGIQPNDVITKIGEQEVSVENFVEAISTKTPGTQTEIELIRAGKTITLSVKLREKRETPRTFSVVFSPDGKLLATAGDDQTIRLWDTETGKEVFSFPGQKVNFSSLTFSPDGRYLAAAGQESVVKVWDLVSRQEYLNLTGRCGQVSRVAFSPDGTLFATAGAKGVVKLWDVGSGEDLLTFSVHDDTEVYGIAFSPDGTKLATAGLDATATLWKIEYDKMRSPFSATAVRTFAGHTNTILDVTFSPDGARLITAGYDRVVKIWEVESGSEISTLVGHNGMIEDVDISPDGTRLITASADKKAKVWQLSPEKELLTLSGHAGVLFNVAYSPDGSRLATGSRDGTARVWDAKSGKELLSLSGHEGIVSGVAFSADGRSLATSGNDQTIKIWDLSSGTEKQTLQGHEGPVCRVVFSSDGKRLASASFDHTAKVWDLELGKVVLTLSKHTDKVYGIAFSPDGNKIATTSKDGWTFVWDARSGEVLFFLPRESTWNFDIVFSPDGTRLATAGRGGEVKVWDIASQKDPLNFSSHTPLLMSIAFSPDGKRLATIGQGGVVEVWDAKSGDLVFSFRGLGNNVYGLSFSPDGRILAVPGNDQQAHLFALDVDTLSALARDRVSRSLTTKECVEYLSMPECPPSAEALRRFIEARTLARNGDLEGAVAGFRSALELDPSMKIDPANEAGRYAAEAKKERGLSYARSLDVERAVELLQEAKGLDPSLDFDPQTEAGRLAALTGSRLAMEGKIDPAIEAYTKAQSLDPQWVIPPEYWNVLCWFGSLHHHAADVMFACDQAVTLAPDGLVGLYRDSRGVARALSGDTQGAIEDFQAYVDSSKNEELKAKRTRWIEVLRAGENPFDAEELEALIGEEGM